METRQIGYHSKQEDHSEGSYNGQSSTRERCLCQVSWDFPEEQHKSNSAEVYNSQSKYPNIQSKGRDYMHVNQKPIISSELGHRRVNAREDGYL